MSDKGYIRIPRSLFQEDEWKDLSLIQQHVFEVIIRNASYKKRKVFHRGVELELQPGQLCLSIRELLEKCHGDISKNDVERAIKKLTFCQFVRQEVRQKKSILTITHKETYELILNESETKCETSLRQKLDKVQSEAMSPPSSSSPPPFSSSSPITPPPPYSSSSPSSSSPKKGKNLDFARSGEVAESEESLTQTASPLRQKIKEDSIQFSIEENKFTGITESDLLSWKEAYPGVDFTQEIARAQEWVKSNPTKMKKMWRKFLTSWFNRCSEKIYQTKAYASQKPDRYQPKVDRRTKNMDGTPVDSPLDRLF